MNFRVEESLFDNGLLANRVGKLYLLNNDEQDIKSVFKQSIEYARKNAYDLLLLKTTFELPDIDGLTYLCKLNNLSIDTSALLQRIKKVKNKFSIRDINHADWIQIAELIKQAPATRFDKDIRLTREIVIKHKLKILIDAYSKWPQLSFVALDKGDKIIGCHFSYVEDNVLILRDILVDEHYRSGFAAIQLIRENFEHIASYEISGILTKIYDDNIASKNFFMKLGAVPLEQFEYFYHIWVTN